MLTDRAKLLLCNGKGSWGWASQLSSWEPLGGNITQRLSQAVSHLSTSRGRTLRRWSEGVVWAQAGRRGWLQSSSCSGWQAREAAELLLLPSSSGGTRCAARLPMPSVTCLSSAAAPRPPARPTCTCRMGTSAGMALATATRDAASPRTCIASGSMAEVTGCAGGTGTAQGQGRPQHHSRTSCTCPLQCTKLE